MLKKFSLIFLGAFTLSMTASANQYDNPKLQGIRGFLEGLSGKTYSLQGSPACANLDFKMFNDSVSKDPVYEQIEGNFGKGHDYVGGTVLYSSVDELDKKCSIITQTRLHCKFSENVSYGGAASSNKVVTEFDIRKNAQGELIRFSIYQSTLPSLDLDCSR